MTALGSIATLAGVLFALVETSPGVQTYIVEKSSVDEKMQEAFIQHPQLLADIASLNTQLDQANELIRELADRNTNLAQDVIDLETQVANLATEANGSGSTIDDLNSQIAALANEKANLELENSRLLREIERLGNSELHVISDNTPEMIPNQVLFYDDFEDGRDSAWSPMSGTWIEESGKFSVQENNDKSYYVFSRPNGSDQWDNYAVEADIWDGNSAYRGGILIRVQQDIDDFVIVRWYGAESLNIYVSRDGDWESCDGRSPGITSRAKIRVEAVEDTYTVFMRQGDSGVLNEVLRCTDSTYSTGYAGIYLNQKDWRGPGASIDNFTVSSLSP